MRRMGIDDLAGLIHEEYAGLADFADYLLLQSDCVVERGGRGDRERGRSESNNSRAASTPSGVMLRSRS